MTKCSRIVSTWTNMSQYNVEEASCTAHRKVEEKCEQYAGTPGARKMGEKNS